MIKIPEDLIPGKSFKIYYGESHISNHIVHIRAIVDDEIVVFKWWHRGTQRWIYATQSLYYFKALSESGHLQEC